MKTLIIIISTLILLFSIPSFAQELTIDQQIEILNYKLNIVRLRQGLWLEQAKRVMPLQLLVEEKNLINEIARLTKLQEKQEAKEKANEEKPEKNKDP